MTVAAFSQISQKPPAPIPSESLEMGEIRGSTGFTFWDKDPETLPNSRKRSDLQSKPLDVPQETHWNKPDGFDMFFLNVRQLRLRRGTTTRRQPTEGMAAVAGDLFHWDRDDM